MYVHSVQYDVMYHHGHTQSRESWTDTKIRLDLLDGESFSYPFLTQIFIQVLKNATLTDTHTYTSTTQSQSIDTMMDLYPAIVHEGDLSPDSVGDAVDEICNQISEAVKGFGTNEE
jgi:hypothetical protein